MSFPQIVLNDAGLSSLEAMLDWLPSRMAALETSLKDSGAIVFRGFPVATAEDFDALVRAFPYPGFTYQESLSNAVRINFTERVFTANEAPPDVEIFLHHEMAQTPISPRRLFFFCQSAAQHGGATPLCRSDRLFASLKDRNPSLARAFAERGVRYVTRMPAADDPGSGQGRGWRSTLSVDTQVEAEEKLGDLGYRYVWGHDGGLAVTSPRLPATLTLEDGSTAFYNQMVAAYLGWAGVRDAPESALSYGDGSLLAREDLELVAELAYAHTTDVVWQDGDVALVDNHRVMHGRRPYSGDRARRVLVAMGA